MRSFQRALLTVFVVSAATLLYEIALTRVFAVAQWYHLGFLSIGVALLGYGASGSFLARRDHLAARPGMQDAGHPSGLLAIRTLIFSASIVGSYLAINYLPFDSYRIAWEPVQILYLLLYYLALVLPFFVSGLITGAFLTYEPVSSHLVYAASLAGSAIGSLSVWVVIPALGESGAVVAAALLGAMGALVSLAPDATVTARRRWVALLCGTVFWAVGLVASLLWPPAFLEIKLSPYKSLSQLLRIPGAEITFRASNVFSRVVTVESEAIRSAPGLSLAYDGAIPPQVGLVIDGTDLQPITRWRTREDQRFTSYLPEMAPFALSPQPRVLILNPAGGLAVQTALAGGAKSVVAVEDNPLVVEILRDVYGEFAGDIYRDPRVTVVREDGRAFLRRSAGEFDVILMALSDPFRPVASGAYSLTEDYTLTREAMSEALELLSEGGILAATRWLQYPPSEGVRLASLMIEALNLKGISEVSEHLVAFRSWSTLMVLARPAGFQDAQIAWLRDFCTSRQFDWVHYPGMTAAEANQYNIYQSAAYYTVISELLSEPPPQRLLTAYEFEITPPTDDRPFFFHFFRWRQLPELVRRMGKTWEPFGGSGYLLLLIFLALAMVVSLGLIILPLGRSRLSGTPGKTIARVVAYFAGIGLGFLFLEIALIQQLVLFLGKPIYAFSTVLFTLLCFSGLGSLYSQRIPRRWATMGLLLSAVGCLLLRRASVHLIELGLPLKLVMTAVALAPLGFFMGLPMPHGIKALGSQSARLRAWAWGINGCASVLASVLAMLIALSWGYTVVMLTGIAAYALALLVHRGTDHAVEEGSLSPEAGAPG